MARHPGTPYTRNIGLSLQPRRGCCWENRPVYGIIERSTPRTRRRPVGPFARHLCC